MHPDKSLNLMKTIMSCAQQDISILETDSIQAITSYKWKKYTRSFFAKQLCWMLIYLVSFLVDLHFLIEDEKDPNR